MDQIIIEVKPFLELVIFKLLIILNFHPVKYVKLRKQS